MTFTTRWVARPILLAVALLALGGGAALAQLGSLAATGSGPPVNRDEPVTFTADQVEYDRERSLVTARGHVEAWQGGRVLRADQMTFDRNTGVSIAIGNVVLMELNGQVMFAQYAELNRDMSEGILKAVRGVMDRNARLAANGMRRTGGVLNELSRVVYSACDLCKDNPTRPLLWQLEASSAVQDTEHKTIEYRDAVMRMGGIPIAYAPFFWHPDPSVPRQSGLLPPLFGASSNVGVFFAQPYYWVIDGQSDATFTPMLTSRSGGVLDAKYRARFNNGTLTANIAGGIQDGGPQGSFSAQGQFAIDDTWRWGFDINRASSSRFVLNQHILLGLSGDANIQTSTVYLEGFGQGSYSRLDVRGYQGLTSAIATSQLPVVAPRYLYSYSGTPDRLGGRLSLDTGLFNVLRYDGTSTRRAHLTMNWERPFQGPAGDLWKISVHGDSAAYDASNLHRQPNFAPRRNADTAQAQAGIALDFRWPFMRDAGAWGTQVVEPMLQLVVSPRTGDSQFARIPNEDSFSFEFSDANLFGFNRFSGIDRLEGGTRLNAALHGTWYLGGTLIDGLVGQSYQTARDNMFPAGSGLRDTVSDIVARGSFSPAKWLDLTYRTRLDKKTMQIRMADATVTAGTPKFQVSGGYLYSVFDPYFFYVTARPPASTSAYFTPRNEISATISSRWEHYRVSAYVRRNLTTNQMDYYGASAAYEDECFIFDVRFTRRLTSLLNDNGSTALLFFLTFKTVGQVGYRAF
ncbi:MAG: LPS-assembly protein LptD [Acetobacteraceae bacterium]|nr:LPS-assembly protein LptD [Acetobacteraceae bacterium]